MKTVVIVTALVLAAFWLRLRLQDRASPHWLRWATAIFLVSFAVLWSRQLTQGEKVDDALFQLEQCVTLAFVIIWAPVAVFSRRRLPVVAVPALLLLMWVGSDYGLYRSRDQVESWLSGWIASVDPAAYNQFWRSLPAALGTAGLLLLLGISPNTKANACWRGWLVFLFVTALAAQLGWQIGGGTRVEEALFQAQKWTIAAFAGLWVLVAVCSKERRLPIPCLAAILVLAWTGADYSLLHTQALVESRLGGWHEAAWYNLCWAALPGSLALAAQLTVICTDPLLPKPRTASAPN